MPLHSGTRLGAYEILSLIGSGAMGEVYRARDPRLRRDVAIKVLPEACSADRDRLDRFELEARAAAALNHPNILAVYDIGVYDRQPYVVTELLDGQTLRDLLAGGAVPMKHAIDYAVQVANGLAAAHDKGIVHRDLKPENLFITQDQRVKILDFGLAKLTEVEPVLTGVSVAPTTPPRLTQPGLILGTVGYMSPEQVRGLPVDDRADLFALGAVLYEMLTGQQAFQRQTTADTMTAILKEQPDLSGAGHSIPPGLARIMDRCLEKTPAARFQSAHDLAFALAGLSGQSASNMAQGPESLSRYPSGRLLALAAIVSVAVLATSLAFTFTFRRSTSLPVTARLTLALSGTDPLSAAGLAPAIAISPDGTLVAHATFVNGRFGALRLRALNDFESRPVAGTDGAAMPFFSPDGQWVGFVAGRQLKKAAIADGVILPIGDVPDFLSHPRWTSDGSILFSSQAGIFTIAASGGVPRLLVPADQGQSGRLYGTPTLLPDAQTLLFADRTASASWNDAHIVAYDIRTTHRKTVLDGGYGPEYLPTGHLLFARTGSLFVVPFNPSRVTTTGTPVRALQDVITGGGLTLGGGTGQLGISANGTVVYVESVTDYPPSHLVWVERNGHASTAMDALQRFAHPRLSPDGRSVAVEVHDPANYGIWIGDLARGTFQRLTFDARESESPIWHPDGSHVAFAATRDTDRFTLIKAADGSGEELPLFSHERGTHQHLGSWSPDGRVVAMTRVGGGGQEANILTLTLDDKRALKPFVQTRFAEQAPMFSPDGKWIAYMSAESGRMEIYGRPFPGPGGKRQISTEGGSEPAWNRNGRELFYRNGDRMMIVPVELEPTFRTGMPRVLFEGRFVKIPWGERDYDVAPDGSRFLMIGATEVTSRAEVKMVLNWFSELQARVPSK